MKKYPSTATLDPSPLITPKRVAITLAVTIATTFFVFLIVWMAADPVQDAQGDLEDKVYYTAAFDAAAIQNAVDTAATDQEVIAAVARNPYISDTLTPGAVVAPGAVAWSAMLYETTTVTDFLSTETVAIRSCVRYLASLEERTVQAEPVPCMEIEQHHPLSDAARNVSWEVTLDRARLQAARDARNNRLDCQAIGEGRSVCK